MNKIVEEEYDYDPNAMDKIETCNFKGPLKDIHSAEHEIDYDKSGDNYSDTFEKLSETYKTKQSKKINEINENIKIQSNLHISDMNSNIS